MHLLTVHTAAGRLYEVDVRLRPSGKGGLAFTQIGVFENYQRARGLDLGTPGAPAFALDRGDAALGAAFAAIRKSVLIEAVKRQNAARGDRRDARAHARRDTARPRDGLFDLKQDRGGIADIEFLAQYWVLQHVSRYPPLAEFPDTIRQLESVGSAALVDHRVIDRLVDAYRAYRQAAHHLSLEQRPAVVDARELAAIRSAVAAVWGA